MVQKMKLIFLFLFLASCKNQSIILPDNIFVVSPEEGSLVSRHETISCNNEEAMYYVCMHVDDLIEIKHKFETECKR